MPDLPVVDVNLFVHNCATTVADAIESVLIQTWPSLTLTLIDDASTDGTWTILREHAARDARIRLKRNRCNGGAVANFQRGFWFGDADYVMPKSGDDLIAPDFIARTMDILLRDRDCAMCHAAGLVFTGDRDVRYTYPASHNLHTVDDDRLMRAHHVMATYTSSPSFWGVYRRACVDRLSPIRYRAGWDHVVLAELALHGTIRHVPDVLYWRRDGGKSVLDLARAATEQATRRLPLDGPLAEQRWRTPLITTAYAHLETFAATRLDEADRIALMDRVGPVFRARWLSLLRREADMFLQALPPLLDQIPLQRPVAAAWMAQSLWDSVQAIATILPDENVLAPMLELAAIAGNRTRVAA